MKHRHTTQQCGIDDCGRDIPDTAYVCTECADTLTRLLALLPDQVGERAQVLIHPHLPHDPASNPYRETGDLPVRHGLAADLDAAITKPTVVRADAADAAFAQTAAHTPLPYGYTPSEAKWALLDTLRRWGDDIAHRRGLHRPYDTLQALGGWHGHQVQWLRQQPDGPDAIGDLTAALRNALRVIDRPADRKYAGPCTGSIVDQDGLLHECTAELYARPQARRIECRDCGATYDVASRRAWLLDQAEDVLLPATELARAIDGLGVDVTPSMIRGWVHRGRLLARPSMQPRPVYRVGDVLELVRGRLAGARATVSA